MVCYKNIMLNISNGLNSLRVSNVPNPYADQDAQILSRACFPDAPITGSNGKKYFYFGDNYLDINMIQYILNQNGVLAYRRYSGYRVFYGNRRAVVRVPLEYLDSHPIANAFMNQVINSKSKAQCIDQLETLKYIELVQKRMR